MVIFEKVRPKPLFLSVVNLYITRKMHILLFRYELNQSLPHELYP